MPMTNGGDQDSANEELFLQIEELSTQALLRCQMSAVTPTHVPYLKSP